MDGPVDATEGYGAPKAVYLLDYFGRLHEVMPLTTDPEAMVRVCYYRVERYNALRDSLRIAAEDTGGRAYEFTTRVAEALDEIRTDVERSRDPRRIVLSAS